MPNSGSVFQAIADDSGVLEDLSLDIRWDGLRMGGVGISTNVIMFGGGLVTGIFNVEDQ